MCNYTGGKTMKTIFKILLIICFITISIQIAKTQITDTCWTMYFPDEPANGFYNPDSVLYDSCYCKDRIVYGCDSIYAKQWFEIHFNNKDPYNFPPYPKDTIIETTWQELDSSYVELRNMFQGLENIYGQFILRKKFPEDTNSWSSGSRAYLIKFQNYVHIIKVLNNFSDTHLLDFYDYRNRCIWIRDDVQDDKSFINDFTLEPNPCNNNLIINISSNNFNNINLKIIDILGNIYEQLNATQFKEQLIKINTENLPVGIYFCIIDTGKYRLIRKFIKTN